MKFFKVCGAVLTLMLVGIGVSVLYDTFTSGVPSTTGSVLVGAVACSSALILFFLLCSRARSEQNAKKLTLQIL